MKGLVFIYPIKKYGRTINSFIFSEYCWIRINTKYYSLVVYFKLKSKGIIIIHKFILTSIKFYNTENLGRMTLPLHLEIISCQTKVWT